MAGWSTVGTDVSYAANDVNTAEMHLSTDLHTTLPNDANAITGGIAHAGTKRPGVRFGQSIRHTGRA